VPAMQDHPVLRCRMPETGLDHGWAQGDVWHNEQFELPTGNEWRVRSLNMLYRHSACTQTTIKNLN